MFIIYIKEKKTIVIYTQHRNKLLIYRIILIYKITNTFTHLVTTLIYLLVYTILNDDSVIDEKRYI